VSLNPNQPTCNAYVYNAVSCALTSCKINTDVEHLRGPHGKNESFYRLHDNEVPNNRTGTEKPARGGNSPVSPFIYRNLPPWFTQLKLQRRCTIPTLLYKWRAIGVQRTKID